MHFLQILYLILCLKLTLSNRLYSDYIDDISQEDIRIRPTADNMHPNFYSPLPKPKPTRKPKPNMPVTTEKLCEKVLRKKKEQEALENPKKEYKPSGNRWHGSISYGREHKKQMDRRTRLGDIDPRERKMHKCYKWIRPKDITRYEWPAIIQGNKDDEDKENEEDKRNILIEICCPKFGPVRVMSNTLCKPYCRSCRNGKCIAPEVCMCHDGYVLTDNLDCVFTCPISCLNGHCNLLSRGCLCNSGYELNETGEFCRPICRNGCGTNRLHNCTAPNTCGCVRDHVLTDNDCQRVLRGG